MTISYIPNGLISLPVERPPPVVLLGRVGLPGADAHPEHHGSGLQGMDHGAGRRLLAQRPLPAGLRGGRPGEE